MLGWGSSLFLNYYYYFGIYTPHISSSEPAKAPALVSESRLAEAPRRGTFQPEEFGFGSGRVRSAGKGGADSGKCWGGSGIAPIQAGSGCRRAAPCAGTCA